MPGYFRKRGKSYQLIVTLGTDYTGKPIRFSKSLTEEECKTDAQAKRALAKFYAECCDGNAKLPTTITVKGLCDMYMDKYVKLQVKANTLRGYLSILKRIEPIEKTKAEKLSKRSVQDWINNMSTDHTDKDGNEKAALSPKTIKNTISFLHSTFEWGIKMELVSKNPCIGIDKPKQINKEAASYTDEDVETLLKGLECLPDDFLNQKVSILLAVFGGLRRGEICGLNWEDVDECGVNIIRTRNIAIGKGVFEDTPKTEKSKRYVELPKEVIDEIKKLKKYQDKMAPSWDHNSPALIKGGTGNPIWPNSLGEWVKKFQASLGLNNQVILHGLRHTHASLLINMNEDVAKVSGRLGHAQISTTLNKYTHLFNKRNETLTNNLSRKFFNSDDKN